MSEPDAAELLRELRRQIAEGTLSLEYDWRRLDHIDSPVAVQADSNVWVYAAVPLCGLAFWGLGWRLGAASIAVALLVYLTLGRAYVRRRIARRIRERALQDSELWRRLWRFGGIALVPIATGAERCRAPDGNWMALARRSRENLRDAGGADRGGAQTANRSSR